MQLFQKNVDYSSLQMLAVRDQNYRMGHGVSRRVRAARGALLLLLLLLRLLLLPPLLLSYYHHYD